MEFFEQLAEHDHEQVIAFQNRATGLRGFLAIHDTTRGPAFGGVRIWRYANDGAALNDALRLSRAMTYKAALAELPGGGAKTVILLRDDWKRAEAMTAFGLLVESLRGRYFCARDVGITDDDLAAIGRGTQFVAVEPSVELGDVSENTAIGVAHGLRACLEFADMPKRVRVAIQGVGSVGILLARILKKDGCELIVADVDTAKTAAAAKELGARAVAPKEILHTDCDVLAPCALGGVITPENAGKIRARIVCGSANNILSGPDAADALMARGILYAPDYLVNAGGLIRGTEFVVMGKKDSSESLAGIYGRTLHVLNTAAELKLSPARVADDLAESRLVRPKHYSDLTWSANRAEM
jgi:leucine dehydrogenase